MSFEEVFTLDNLYKSYIKCCKGVNWKTSTKNFKMRAMQNVTVLYQQLKSGIYKSKGFQNFTIRERGKLRDIKAVHISERVVQKCLCDNWLCPLLQKSLIYDNGATIKNKGFGFAVKRLKCHLQRYYRNYGIEGYVLCFDFHHYFDTIDHKLLLEKVHKLSNDERLFNIYKYFVDCFGDVGLGLGSQISQISALFFLNEMDHYVKERLHCKYYARYMDDGYIISNNKEFLQLCLSEIKRIAINLKLELNLKKTRICKINQLVIFNKHWCITQSGHIKVRPIHKSLYRLRRRFLFIKQKGIDKLKGFIASIKGFFKIFDNKRIINYVLYEART